MQEFSKNVYGKFALTRNENGIYGKIDLHHDDRFKGEHMQIAICDDSAKDTKLMREYICRYCSENDIAYEISEAASGEALIKLSNIADYDCICMDIYMDQMNGIDTAGCLAKMGYDGGYIFETSSEEHVFKSFEFNVVDYLVKPFSYEQFERAMNKLMKNKKDGGGSIEISVGGAARHIPIRQIYYVETGQNHGTLFHMKEDVIEATTLISEVEEQLRPYENFYRCHRSYIVNMDNVTGAEGTSVFLKNGENVQIVQRNAAERREYINEYLWNHMMEE